MDPVVTVTCKGKPALQLAKPSRNYWLVAHDGKVAHVCEVGPAQVCTTGLTNLEKFGDEASANARAEQIEPRPKPEQILIGGDR